VQDLEVRRPTKRTRKKFKGSFRHIGLPIWLDSHIGSHELWYIFVFEISSFLSTALHYTKPRYAFQAENPEFIAALLPGKADDAGELWEVTRPDRRALRALYGPGASGRYPRLAALRLCRLHLKGRRGRRLVISTNPRCIVSARNTTTAGRGVSVWAALTVINDF